MSTEIEFTSLISVLPIKIAADDDDVVQAMLVSTKGKDSLDSKATAGRINFLMRDRHGTPFEHNMFKFFVEAPIFVFREFHRHRIGWSYNEESGRYTVLKPRFYVPDDDRELAQVGKPGHYEYVPGSFEQIKLTQFTLMGTYAAAYKAYEDLLAAGIAKEVARMSLPVAIYTSMYATCNARSLMAFLSLRKKLSAEAAMFPSSPMKEINMVADQMEEIFAQHMPLTHAAFVSNKYVSP